MKSNRRDWSRRISKQAKVLAELLENFTDDESAMLRIRRNLISQHVNTTKLSDAGWRKLATTGLPRSIAKHC
jgi:hypothetical protein